MAPDSQDALPPDPAGPPFQYRRLWPLAVILLLTGTLLFSGWHRELSLETLVRHRAALDALVMERYVLAIAAFVALYIVWVALSVPGAFVLAMSGGLLFGGVIGGGLSVFSATVGAACIFLIAKSSVGEILLRRAGPRVTRLAESFRADAFNYLLFLRLFPVVPFFIVNLAPAFVGVPLSTFVLATGIGIIPTTFIYSFVGSGFDSMLAAHESAYRACLASGRPDCVLEFDPKSALTPDLIAALAALAILALLPVIVKRVRARRLLANRAEPLS